MSHSNPNFDYPDGIDKKQYGVFYTPFEVAHVLSKWAIRSSEDTILEPSFGGCHFLQAATHILESIGSQEPKNQLYGCDIDPQAFSYLESSLGLSSNGNNHFHQKDFLRVNVEDFNIVGGFDVVIGNPPYISHHNLPSAQYQLAKDVIDGGDYTEPVGKASLWAYFVLHGMSFLKVGGRMAWVLPSSFLFAEYAASIKESIRQDFCRSLIIQLGERLFLEDGTEEVSILVFCEGYDHKKNQPGTLEISFLPRFEEVDGYLEKWSHGKISGSNFVENATLALLNPEATRSYAEIFSTSHITQLGEFCNIEIGIVSGANHFFIVNEAKAISLSLPDEVIEHVLPRFRYTNGVVLRKSDFRKFRRQGKACLLIDTSKVDEVTGNLKKYLDTFSNEDLASNTTFTRRKRAGKPWHRFNDNRIPDAFFPYMLKQDPYIVINQAKVNSTNAVHRLFFHDSLKLFQIKAIAISMLSTFTQLSVEIEGRSYGAGVLKHEPSEAARISILLPTSYSPEEVGKTFSRIDELVMSNKIEEARASADLFAMKDYPAQRRLELVNSLRAAVEQLRRMRLPNGGG